MTSTEAQKSNALKARIAVVLQNELGRPPKPEEVDQYFMLTRVMWKTVVGLHYQRKSMRKQGQLALF